MSAIITNDDIPLAYGMRDEQLDDAIDEMKAAIRHIESGIELMEIVPRPHAVSAPRVLRIRAQAA